MACFIFIELFLFPLGCGIILDLSTLALFGANTIASRRTFFHYAPTTSILYHWLFGTIYMYDPPSLFCILSKLLSGIYSPRSYRLVAVSWDLVQCGSSKTLMTLRFNLSETYWIVVQWCNSRSWRLALSCTPFSSQLASEVPRSCCIKFNGDGTRSYPSDGTHGMFGSPYLWPPTNELLDYLCRTCLLISCLYT